MLDIKRVFSKVRFCDESRAAEEHRDPFLIDHDRVYFSRPFRRLQQKTQVHPMPHNIHVRNRLVHTIEVASVGRSLGYSVGSKLQHILKTYEITPHDFAAIVQSACLIHDIGNPTFGHAGEEALSEALSSQDIDKSHPQVADFSNFDGNAQGFRIVTKIDGYRFQGGLRLTYASSAAIMKYPWKASDKRSGSGKKFGYFQTETPQAIQILRHVYETENLEDVPRHPATWLMEAADDICYTLADLEDAVELSIITDKEFEDIVSGMADGGHGQSHNEQRSSKLAYLRSLAIGRLIATTVDAFVDRFDDIMSGKPAEKKNLLDSLSEYNSRIAESFTKAKDVNNQKVYFHERKVSFELSAPEIINTLVNTLLPASIEFYEKKCIESCSRRTR